MTPYDLAKAEVGTVEWKDGNNPKVVAYFKDSGNPGVKDDETAWCAAFVGAMLKRAGIKGTGKLNARSYLEWGVPVERKDAKPGDVVVFKRGSSSWQGHVAFFVKDRGALIDVLGGNQSNAVNVKGYQSSALLGIRRAAKGVKPVASGPSQAERDMADLERLGYKDVRAFQRNVGLAPDGVIGPMTRAKMHECLSHKMTRPAANSDATPVSPHVNEKPKNEHEQPDVLKPATKGRAHAMLGKLILALGAGVLALAAGAREWLEWVQSWF